MQPLFSWKINKYYMLWVYVCSITHPACNVKCTILSLVVCLALRYFSTFFEKKLLDIKCVFWFSVQLLSEIFLILRRNERDIIKMFIGLHVKYSLFLSYFNEAWKFSTEFRKILKCKFFWKSVRREPRTEGQTDVMKQIVDFRNFPKAPNKKEKTTSW